MRTLVSAASSALCACRLWGLRSAAGSRGALRLLPEVTAGRDGSRGAVAPAAWGDFGVGVNRGLILSREVNDLILTPEALAYSDRYFLRFSRLKVWMLRGFVFTRSLLGKVLELS